MMMVKEVNSSKSCSLSGQNNMPGIASYGKSKISNPLKSNHAHYQVKIYAKDKLNYPKHMSNPNHTFMSNILIISL